MSMESVKIERQEIFLGFNAYSESDARIFKGRDNDIESLLDLVINNDYVICYAESGEGKSSLIDAGLTPKLRENRCFPVKIAFTDDEYNNDDIDFDKVINSRIENAIADYCMANENAKLTFSPNVNVEDSFVAALNEKFSDDIWWMLRNNMLSIYGIPFKIVLIFDQFEEVVNYPKSKEWTSRFFSWLEKISSDKCPQYILDEINRGAENDDNSAFPEIKTNKNYKAIFSIRTEYIGELDYWCMQRYFIPELKHNRFCLKPLTIKGADEVMMQYEGFDEALRADIKDVLLRSTDTDADNPNQEAYISALILSVICTSLYYNIDKLWSRNMITDSIENFYNDIIEKCHISIDERNVIASVLVDKDKRVRVSSDCDALEKIDFNNKYKDVLLQNRLIKKSIVNGVEYVELVHDSLIDIVKKHKEEALQRELKIKRKRNVCVISVLSSIIVLFVLLVINLKKNERNFLQIQSRHIATKAEEMVKHDDDRYMSVKLLAYLADNNKESLKCADFEHAVRTLDANYEFPEKRFVHQGSVNAAAVSPDGKYIVTSDIDNVAKLFAIENGDCVMTMPHNDVIRSVSFTKDGKYIVTSSLDNTAKSWSVESGECAMTMNHDKSVYAASFSPDGKYIVTLSNDNTARLWSVESGECIVTMKHDNYVNGASFSKDGDYIATSSLDNTAKLWSVESGACVMIMNHAGYVNGAVFSPDGKSIITYSDDNTAKLWSLESGKCVKTMNHNAWLNVTFSPDGKSIVAYNNDNTAKLWSVESGACEMTMNHDNWVNSTAFSPDGRFIVTSSKDNAAKLWSVESGVCVMTMNHDAWVNRAEFTPDGKYIMTCSNDNTVKLWSIELDTFKMPMNQNNDLDGTMVSPDGKYNATVTKNKTVELWQAKGGKRVMTMGHDSYVFSVEFSPDGKYIVTSSGDKTARLWSIEKGVCVMSMNHDYYIRYATFSPDGNYIVTYSDDDTAKSFEMKSVDDIIDEWMGLFNGEVRLTQEEKERYFIN